MVNERPSAGWLGSEGLEVGTLRDQVQAVLSATNFQQLEKLAVATRFQHDNTTEPSTVCTINPSVFTHGFKNVVFELEFSDSVYWIARMQLASTDSADSFGNGIDLRSEIATMKTVKEQTRIPVPEVYTYDATPDNEIGHPYVLMEFLPGQVLDGPIAVQVPPEHMPKVAKQLAEVMFQLHGLTFDRLGRLYCDDDGMGSTEIIPADFGEAAPGTSLEWFYTQRQEANRETLESHPNDPEWLAACWVLKTAMQHIIIESRLHGPFPLCHIDLHHGNLLFDGDYNLVGVIDWDQAQTVPLERLAVCPEFVTFPAGLEANNRRILAFKALVVEHLQCLEQSGHNAGQDPGPLLSQLVGSKRAEITHRCTYSFPHRALWDGRLVASLIYGDQISWAQLLQVYGGMELD